MILGIDLGTTNSASAIIQDGKAVLVPSRHEGDLTPSIVSEVSAREIVVGRPAKEMLVTAPTLTAQTFKRFMGTKKQYFFNKSVYTPVDLSSFVLRTLKEDAEKHLGLTITDAIITVPAYFSNPQREATKDAARLAGLNPIRLINEPTAAALAYSLHEAKDETMICVLDLGGGTFDVSIIEKFEDIMEVHASGGDNYLGGEDFTALIFDHLMGQLPAPAHTDASVQARLRHLAEEVKMQLSQSEVVERTMVWKGDTHKLGIDRPTFERKAESLLERITRPVERALSDAKLKPSDFDYVVLVGGATRMPMIRRFAASFFGKFPLHHLDPDTVVAQGAAICGAILSKSKNFEDKVLTDVCPFSLGIASAKKLGKTWEYDVFSPIIERNQKIPISRVNLFHPIDPTQKNLHLRIFQGESRNTENNILIGELKVPIEKQPSDTENVNVRFTYDVSGLLEVEATVESTQKHYRIVVNGENSSLTPAEIEKRFRELNEIKIHPKDRAENQYIKNWALRLYEECLGENRQILDSLLGELDQAFATQDSGTIDEFRQQATLVLQRIERSLKS